MFDQKCLQSNKRSSKGSQVYNIGQGINRFNFWYCCREFDGYVYFSWVFIFSFPTTFCNHYYTHVIYSHHHINEFVTKNCYCHIDWQLHNPQPSVLKESHYNYRRIVAALWCTYYRNNRLIIVSSIIHYYWQYAGTLYVLQRSCVFCWHSTCTTNHLWKNFSLLSQLFSAGCCFVGRIPPLECTWWMGGLGESLLNTNYLCKLKYSLPVYQMCIWDVIYLYYCRDFAFMV